MCSIGQNIKPTILAAVKKKMFVVTATKGAHGLVHVSNQISSFRYLS